MNAHLRFASTIRFVPEDVFYRRAQKCPKPTNINRFKVPMADVHGSKERLFTEGIIMCNAGGFQNGQYATMFHVYPDAMIPGQACKITRTVEHILDVLKMAPTQARALLIGGASLYPATMASQKAMAEQLKAAGVPFSLLSGHKGGAHSNLHYDLKTDTWSVSVFKRRGSHMDVPDSLKALSRIYEAVEIDPGDRLSFSHSKF